MAIIKKTLKLGTALGLTYLSVEQRLWSQLSHEEIKGKLSAFKTYNKNAVTLMSQKTGLDSTQLTQWIPTQESLNLNTINAKNLWNQSIKTSVRMLADLDLNGLVAKVQKLLNSK